MDEKRNKAAQDKRKTIKKLLKGEADAARGGALAKDPSCTGGIVESGDPNSGCTETCSYSDSWTWWPFKG